VLAMISALTVVRIRRKDLADADPAMAPAGDAIAPSRV
jgi:hypothetical protein